MTQADLFTGIGGFLLAGEWMGWEPSFYCEKEESCLKVLKNKFPYAKQYKCITESIFTEWLNLVDILTGGDPCQPSSYAGLRGGITDPRYLWPHMHRVIKEVQPCAVVNENVEGTISNGILDRKISDLESEGFTVWPTFVIPANAFGSLHQRNRVWLVAHSERNIKSRKKSCDRTVRRMGGEFQPMAWNYDWENTLHSFRGMDDGLSARVDQTDGTRNAIVPQIALHIFKSIEYVIDECKTQAALEWWNSVDDETKGVLQAYYYPWEEITIDKIKKIHEVN